VLVEWLGHEIYAATAGLVLGHSLKHLVAALGAYLAYRMVRLRQPAIAQMNSGPSPPCTKQR